jgi:hypothetical protein
VAGLVILGVLISYIAVFWFLAVNASKAKRIVLVAVALLIPFWDLPIGFIHFRLHCRDGGLHTLASPPHADSILLKPGVGYRPEYLAKFGFTTIEYETSPVRLTVYSVTDKGLQKSTSSNSTSTLELSQTYRTPLGWNVLRNELTLSVRGGGQPIARHTNFGWLGPWWYKELFPMAGNIQDCHVGGDRELLRFAARATK